MRGLARNELGQSDAAVADLERALKVFESVSTDTTAEGAAKRLDHISVINSLASLRHNTQGDHQRTEQLLRRALMLLDQLDEAAVDGVALLDAQFRSHLAMGHLKARELEWDVAIEHLAAARDVNRTLSELRPRQRSVRRDGGLVARALAEALDFTGQHAGAIEHYEESVACFRDLYRDYPESQPYGTQLARCLRGYGVALARSGRHEDGRTAFADALELLDDKDESMTMMRLSLRAQCVSDLARATATLAMAGTEPDLTEAEELYGRAAELHRRVVANLTDPWNHHILANTLYDQAAVRIMAGGAQPAMPLLREALKHHRTAISKQPGLQPFDEAAQRTLSVLNEAALRAHDPETAIEAARTFVEFGYEGADLELRMARTFARCSRMRGDDSAQRARDIDAAFNHLNAALELGTPLERILRDSQLNPLRRDLRWRELGSSDK